MATADCFVSDHVTIYGIDLRCLEDTWCILNFFELSCEDGETNYFISLQENNNYSLFAILHVIRLIRWISWFYLEPI